MLTTFQEVDMGNLIELRNKYKDEFEKSHGVKLGFMSAFVRVSVDFCVLMLFFPNMFALSCCVDLLSVD